MAKKAAKGAAAKKKRTVSGRRGKPGRKNNQGTDTRGVVGIVVFCIGFLALLCQFIPSDGGFLNRCMLVVRGLGGMLCLLLPVVLCWTGAVLVFFREKKWSTRTLILGSLIFLFVEAMFQLFRISGVNAALAADGVEVNYGVFLVRSFTMSSLDCKGGGFIGALLAWPLYKALDVWGGMIVLIFATAIVLMAMTGFSFGGIGMRISEWIDDFRVDMQERREEKDALRDARQEEELERENALAIERQKRRQERLQKQKEEQFQHSAHDGCLSLPLFPARICHNTVPPVFGQQARCACTLTLIRLNYTTHGAGLASSFSDFLWFFLRSGVLCVLRGAPRAAAPAAAAPIAGQGAPEHPAPTPDTARPTAPECPARLPCKGLRQRPPAPCTSAAPRHC